MPGGGRARGRGMGVTSLERGSASRAPGWPVPRATAAREGFLPFFWGDAGGHGAKGRSYWVAALGCSSTYPPALCALATGETDGEGAGLGKDTKCTKQAQISYLRHCWVSSRNLQRRVIFRTTISLKESRAQPWKCPVFRAMSYPLRWV